jgi:hypothetical protein
LGMLLRKENGMTKDECAEERAAREKFEGWLRETEAAAAELVEMRSQVAHG